MAEQEAPQKKGSEAFINILASWWPIAVLAVVGTIVALTAQKEVVKQPAMDVAGGERAVGTQVADQSDVAQAEYTGVETASSDLPSWIFEDNVFGFPAYCAVINTDQFGQTEHFDKNAPIVSTVHEILTELGNRVYKDKIVLIQGKEVHVRDVSAIGYYANKTEVCAVQAPSSIPITP